MVSQVTGGRDRLGLLLIGNRGLPSADIAKSLDVRVIGSLPDDADAASVLSDGTGRRTRLDRKPLMRAAQGVGLAIGQFGRPRAPQELTSSQAGNAQ